MKPFIREAFNGIMTAMDAEQIANQIDESPATRLAVVLFNKGVIDGTEFLNIIHPSRTFYEYRVRGEFDIDII